jgi:16S rRNA (cytosine967-C5)-methyltransferase
MQKNTEKAQPVASSSASGVPLWRLLQGTASVVAAVRGGRSMTALLEAQPQAIRPGVQALSFQVMRWLGRAQALRAQLARKAPPPAADALLCSALALCWSDDLAPYPAFTLVDQTVEAARQNKDTRAQANFVNACLRRFLREREALIQLTDEDPLARWNHPQWWVKKLQNDHAKDWEAILTASQAPAPMTLRVNAVQTTVAAYLAQLDTVGLKGKPVGASGIELSKAAPVHMLPGFASGVVSVQDAGAQLAAPLLLQGLDVTRPLRLLDACAAPGGKTGHLLELCPAAQVVALDVDPIRCERVVQNLDRLKVHAQVVAADASQPDRWWDGQLFDAILLDAPCTASGIGRRHPDVRWLRRESDVPQLAQIQARLLKTLWPLLKPGGQLVYCTCSIFLAEGHGQIQTFLKHNTDAVLLPSPGHLIPQNNPISLAVQDNQAGEHDGFYYALLQKQP